MEKLTKKQHREIITNLINKNHNVKDLRNIQQVTEIFKEDAELRKEGSVLVAADAIRLLMDLFEEGNAAEAEKALYDLKEDATGELYRITTLLDKLDDTQLRHVYFFIRGMLGRK